MIPAAWVDHALLAVILYAPLIAYLGWSAQWTMADWQMWGAVACAGLATFGYRYARRIRARDSVDG